MYITGKYGEKASNKKGDIQGRPECSGGGEEAEAKTNKRPFRDA